MRCDNHNRQRRLTTEVTHTPDCAVVAVDLVDAAAGDRLLDGPGRHHVAGCARCRGELEEHRRLARVLPSLRHVTIEPPEGLLDDVLAALDASGGRPVVIGAWGRRAAYVSGLAAAAAGGALVIANRSRRRLRPAS